MFCSIQNIQPEDAGTYSCIARNEYGESEPLRHTIVVTRPTGGGGGPPAPPTIDAPATVELGQTVGVLAI